MNRFPRPALSHLLAGALLAGCAGLATAQAPAMPAGHAHPAAGAAATTGVAPSTQAYQSGHAAMMKGMDQPYTGDADADFVAHMIPHHEGAVAMAEVQLKYGKDPALRKMAQDIIRAQKQEIDFMKKWQAKRGNK